MLEKVYSVDFRDYNPLVGWMQYVGQSSTDPSTGTVTIESIVITPENGNVCRYQTKDFIYDSGACRWLEID